MIDQFLRMIVVMLKPITVEVSMLRELNEI